MLKDRIFGVDGSVTYTGLKSQIYTRQFTAPYKSHKI